MRAPTFLLNSCDGSQDPITAILDISKEDLENKSVNLDKFDN